MSTIAELLTLGGCQFKVFDLGRKVQKVSRDEFIAFEQGTKPYPYPIQGHACFAIAFSKPEQAQFPFLWLLKFPLDELSKLEFAHRDHFLKMVLEALGNDIANANMDAEALNNHPYSLKTSQEKQALLNARLRKELHQPTSLYYESAFQYYCQHPTEQGWQALGIQGIADLVLRLNEKEVLQGLCENLSALPEPAFNALAQCLEHVALPAQLVTSLMALPRQLRSSFWLRAISGAPLAVSEEVVDEVLAGSTTVDELITLSARLWPALSSPQRALAYFEAVTRAENSPQLFAALLADLNGLPECRPACMQALRSPERSPELAELIGQLFHSMQAQTVQ